MKKMSKVLVCLFALSMMFSVFGITSVAAAEAPPIEVPGDTWTARVQAGNLTQFTFQNRTQLRFNASVNIDLIMSCQAMQIGAKTFEMEVESDQDMQMNMTCTEEQNQLGLMLGHTYQIRNRNRNHRYQEGFCLEIQSNYSYQIQVKLKMKETNQNRNGEWAYYEGAIGQGEWVAVQTTSQNGYRVAETTHFSYWTILVPEDENIIPAYNIYFVIIGAIIGVVAIVATIYVKKRK